MHTVKKSYLERVLGVWGGILIAWSLYRAFMFESPFWFDEIFIKPFLFIVPVWYFLKDFAKKDLFTDVKLTKKTFFADFAIMASMLVALIFGLLITNHSLFTEQNLNTTLVIIIAALCTGFSQEILLRGFVASAMHLHFKSIPLAIFFSSILQIFLYIPIFLSKASELRGNQIIDAFFVTLLAAIMNGSVFFARKSLWISIVLQAIFTYAIIALTITQ